MTAGPGYGEDLDALVVSAIAEGEPQRSFSRPYEISYLATVTLHGRFDLAKDLVEAGAQASVDDFYTIVYWGGDIADIDFLSKYRPLSSNDYTSLLESALDKPRWCLFRELLSRGADANMLLSDNWNSGHGTKHPVSILHVAAFSGAGEAVECLLLNGAEVDRRDGEEMTPLMKVCDFRRLNHQGNVETAFWLLEHGANPNAVIPSGASPLLLCIGENLFVDRNPEIPIVRANVAGLLLRYGADPNILSPAKTTPLMLAARDDNAPLARALLRYGADATIKAPNGKTALDVAIERKSKEVQAMLESASSEEGEVTMPLTLSWEEEYEEGRLEEARRLLLLVGAKRLGPPPVTTSEQILAIPSIERLESMADRLLEVEKWDDLLAS